VRVFTAAGAPVASFEWEGGRLAGAGWTDAEDLVFVAGSGRVTLFDPWGGAAPRSLTLGEAAERDGLAAADTWGGGVVAVTRGGAVVAVSGLVEGGGGGMGGADGGVASATAPRLEVLASVPVGGGGGGGGGAGAGARAGGAGFAAPPAAASAGPGAGTGGPGLAPGPSGGPSAVAALPPAASPTGGPAAIVAVGADLYLVTASAATLKATAPAPVTTIALSPCGAFLAGFTVDGRLLVWASDFSAALSEFATQADEGLAGLAWCGADAVLLLWGGGLALLVGPYGDWVKYDVPGAAALAPEPDGVRVLGGGRHDLVRRVPDPLADGYRPGSTDGVAGLLDARRALDGGDPAAHARLRELSRRELAEAAAGAAAAARAAVRGPLQAECLKAASLGLAFALGGGSGDGGEGGQGGAASLLSTTKAAAADVASTAALLRTLRCLADPAVGWPLTGGQAAVLGHRGLVGRLARRGHHLLALRVADALHVSDAAGAVATHWAAAVLGAAGAAADDAALLARLRPRLAGVEGVRWGELAGVASAGGRRGLASSLLDAEPDPGVRVPLLLELGDGGRALEAGLRTADPGLVGLVLGRVVGGASADGAVPSCHPPFSLADRARRSRAVRAGLIGLVGGGGGAAGAAGGPEAALAKFLGAQVRMERRGVRRRGARTHRPSPSTLASRPTRAWRWTRRCAGRRGRSPSTSPTPPLTRSPPLSPSLCPITSGRGLGGRAGAPGRRRRCLRGGRLRPHRRRCPGLLRRLHRRGGGLRPGGGPVCQGRVPALGGCGGGGRPPAPPAGGHGPGDGWPVRGRHVHGVPAGGRRGRRGPGAGGGGAERPGGGLGARARGGRGQGLGWAGGVRAGSARGNPGGAGQGGRCP